MRKLPSYFCAVVMCCCVLTFATEADAAPVALTPEELNAAAIVALETGNPAQAAAMAEALISRDPKDIDALVLASRAHRNLGHFEKAQSYARSAWSASQTNQQKFATALIMAQALSSDDKRTRAQLWLRRAAQHAPNERLRKLAERDFRYVRARNPLSVALRFNIAPNSNINNGSTTGRSTFFDPFTQQFVEVELGGATLALSGVEISAGAALRYRFGETNRRATDATLTFEQRSFVLSDKARALAPGAKGRDFATATLSAGLTQRWKSADGRSEYTLGTLVGVNRYAGDPYGEFLRLSAGYTHAIGRKSQLSLDLSADRTRGPLAPHADALRLGAALQQRLSGGGRMTWQLGLSDSRSDVNAADYSEVILGVTHDPKRDLFGADLSYGMRLRARDYPSTPYAAGPRTDREVEAHLSLVFRQVDYYGFNPTMTLRATRTRSNVGLFDSNQFGVEFGISSAF